MGYVDLEKRKGIGERGGRGDERMVEVMYMKISEDLFRKARDGEAFERDCSLIFSASWRMFVNMRDLLLSNSSYVSDFVPFVPN